MYNECNVLESSWNHSPHSIHSSPWTNYLPQNQSLMSKMFGEHSSRALYLSLLISTWRKVPVFYPVCRLPDAYKCWIFGGFDGISSLWDCLFLLSKSVDFKNENNLKFHYSLYILTFTFWKIPFCISALNRIGGHHMWSKLPWFTGNSPIHFHLLCSFHHIYEFYVP